LRTTGWTVVVAVLSTVICVIPLSGFGSLSSTLGAAIGVSLTGLVWLALLARIVRAGVVISDSTVSVRPIFGPSHRLPRSDVASVRMFEIRGAFANGYVLGVETLSVRLP
jgi:hypothetical protein